MTTPPSMAENVSTRSTRSVPSDWREMSQCLRQLREGGGRESDKVVQFGTELIERHGSKLGDEVWIVREQVAVAALDIGDNHTANECLNALSSQFPDSVRVKRLYGLLLESEQRYDEAELMYKEYIESNPTELIMRKRLVAICKAQGKTLDAVKLLNEILETFMTDIESWSELADLYISLHSYDKAAFCLEELLLNNPHHYLYHLRYAEVCYSQGSGESLELSCKHFATALKLNPQSMRALYGMHQAAMALTSNPKHKGRSEVKIRYAKVADWAHDQLKHRYQGHKCCRVVELFLDAVHRSR